MVLFYLSAPAWNRTKNNGLEVRSYIHLTTGAGGTLFFLCLHGKVASPPSRAVYCETASSARVELAVDTTLSVTVFVRGGLNRIPRN